MEDPVMKKLVLALFYLALPAGLLAQTPQLVDPSGKAAAPIAIKAARLFDGKGDTEIQNAVVLIEGSKITQVGSGLSVPAGATVIDLGDATLVPGLIDAHVHLAGESTDNWLQDTVGEL